MNAEYSAYSVYSIRTDMYRRHPKFVARELSSTRSALFRGIWEIHAEFLAFFGQNLQIISHNSCH